MEQVPSLEQIRDFKGKYPRQLWYLFGTEMWERFCFYGMRGMLTVFMAAQLGLDDKAANLQYGAIQAFVYAFTFIGGLFADKILGFQKSLFWGAALMITGGFVIAFSPQELFYIGICFNIIGTGFFKPNISTMVGQLYKDDDHRRDAGFGLFYAGINLGALLGGYPDGVGGQELLLAARLRPGGHRDDHQPDQLLLPPEVVRTHRPLAAASATCPHRGGRSTRSPPTSVRCSPSR